VKPDSTGVDVSLNTVLASAIFLFLVLPTAYAQTSSLTGRVEDPQGGVIAGADVTVSAPGRPERRTRSAADGSFRFDGLPAAMYTVLITAPGFASWTQTVTVGAAPTSVSASLEIAGVSADVTVAGALSGTVATGKTNLPLRELPMTVHGVPSHVIQEQGVNDLVGALQNVPGVYAFTNYGVYEGYSFRGFLDLFPSMANQLVDGVRHEGNRVNSQAVNVERVEVLKGPSSALYGGGAIGATVNIIRKKPSATPAYDFSASAGSWQTFRGTFGATGRLASDAALYRLDIGAEDREGYRHNNANRLSITPSLAWRVTPNDQFNVYYTFNRDRFDGDAGIPLVAPDAGRVEDFFPDVPRSRNLRTPFDFAEAVDHNLQVAYARQLNDSWGVRNTLSFRPVNDDYFLSEFMFVEDDGRTVFREYLQFEHQRRPITNLAEVTASIGGPLLHTLVFGWEGQHYASRTNTVGDIGVVAADPIDLFDPLETQRAVAEPLTRIAHFTHNTNAFYAQDHLTIGPQVKALVGGRFDVFRRTSHNNPVTDGVETEGPLLRREADSFTGRVGLVYQPLPSIDLYGSFANSFRPLTQAQPDGTTLDPEQGRQLELGQRFHVAGGRVQLNTAVFHIVRENVAFARPGGIFDQASDVRSRGFEADVTTSPLSNWRINGGYAYTNAEFGDFLVNASTNLRGNSSIMSPRHTFSVWSGYDWTNGFGVNVGLRSQTEVFIDRENTLTFDGYGVLNVGARYRRGAVEYAVNVNNLTDTEYFSSVLYDTQLYPGEPINVLGTIRVRFR
jgi:iron complex outermembrane receptor protein